MSSPSPRDPLEGLDLVDEALSDAFEELHGYLSLVAGRSLPGAIRGKVGVSDIVQQAMLKAHQQGDGFTGSTSNELKVWLRTIVENTVKDAVRKHLLAEKRSVEREEAVDGGQLNNVRGESKTPSRLVALREQDKLLLSAIDQLPERQRLVVQLRHSYQMSYESIAERLGTTPEAARKIWSRAMKQLRSNLEGNYEL